MRAVVLLAVCLALGSVAIGATPAASACTSDPAVVCAVIQAMDECGTTAKFTDPVNTVKTCLP